MNISFSSLLNHVLQRIKKHAGLRHKVDPFDAVYLKTPGVQFINYFRMLYCNFTHLYAVLLFMFEQQFWTAFWNVDLTFSLFSGPADFLIIWIWTAGSEKTFSIEGSVFTSEKSIWSIESSEIIIWSEGFIADKTISSEGSSAERVFSKVFRNLQGLETKLTPENSFNSKHLKKTSFRREGREGKPLWM